MIVAYRGYVKPDYSCIVTVETDDNEVPLPHFVRHSPDGFSWGFGGSGPSDLARCILLNFLGKEPPPWMYQKFKFDVIAQLPQQQDFTLTSQRVEDWVSANGKTPLETVVDRVATNILKEHGYDERRSNREH